MKGFDRDILETQFEAFFEQMVNNGYFNAPYPVSAITGNWAKFYWGNPERCLDNWEAPTVYGHGFEMVEAFGGLCNDRVTCNFIAGVQAKCIHIRGHESLLRQLWWKMRRAWGRNSWNYTLPGAYRIDDINGDLLIQHTGATLAKLGITGTQVLGNLELDIEGGVYKRYEAQFQFELFFGKPALSFSASHNVTY